MRKFVILATMVGTIGFLGVPAQAANMCKTDTLSCATTMPVGGYCECTARGKTEDGTVAERVMARRGTTARAGGCGAQPNAPGCH